MSYGTAGALQAAVFAILDADAAQALPGWRRCYDAGAAEGRGERNMFVTLIGEDEVRDIGRTQTGAHRRRIDW